ncbi:MAG: hypothetical protein ACR2K2_10340 [Mycobacteriales bacterium]
MDPESSDPESSDPESSDRAQQRTEWERGRRRARRAQDVGLLILTLGVLVLAYVVLATSSR